MTKEVIKLTSALKELREKKKLTKIDVAKALGIHRTTISRIEEGNGSFKAIDIPTLSKLYGVSETRLLKICKDCRK